MSLTYFSICITEYSLSWTCYSLSITCHSLCEHGPGPWVTRFAVIWGSLMDPLLIIHGSSLLDRASGYVDKSFQKDSAHNRVMKGLQGVPAHCNYRYIALPRRFAGFARSPVCGEHCFFWCLSLQVIFDGICRTSWAYGHIRSTLHMCVSMPGIDKIALVVQQLLLQVIPMDMAAKKYRTLRKV